MNLLKNVHIIEYIFVAVRDSLSMYGLSEIYIKLQRTLLFMSKMYHIVKMVYCTFI